MPNKLDLGHVKEGVVEIDPMSGRMVVRCIAKDGSFEFFDVQKTLDTYRDEEIRVVIVPLATIKKVAEMVESGEMPLDQAPKAG